MVKYPLSTYPGAIALTRILCCAHSLDRDFVSWPTAPLLAEYAAILTPPWNVDRLAMLMSLPSILLSIQYLPMSRHRIKGPLKLTSMTSSSTSCEISVAGYRRMIPALLMRISIRYVLVTEAMRPCTLLRSLKSATTMWHLRPRASMLCFVTLSSVFRF